MVVEDGELKVARGSGEFLPCALPRLAEPLGRSVREMDPARNFGAPPAPRPGSALRVPAEPGHPGFELVGPGRFRLETGERPGAE